MKELVVCEEYLNRLRSERDYYELEYKRLVERIPTIKEEAREEYKESLSIHFQKTLREFL